MVLKPAIKGFRASSFSANFCNQDEKTKSELNGSSIELFLESETLMVEILSI
jgi:hypothetical protein